MRAGTKPPEDHGTWFNWWPGPVVTSGRIVAVLLAALALLGVAGAVVLAWAGFAFAGLVALILAGATAWAARHTWLRFP